MWRWAALECRGTLWHWWRSQLMFIYHNKHYSYLGITINNITWYIYMLSANHRCILFNFIRHQRTVASMTLITLRYRALAPHWIWWYIQDCVVRLKIIEQEPVVWSRQRRKTSSWLSGRLRWSRSINANHNPLPSLALHNMDIMILPLLFFSACPGHQIFASPPFFISNRLYLPKLVCPKFCHVWYIYRERNIQNELRNC